jgi:NTE family protein
MSTKRINLALQGGGAHGAFTWGVLDRLLQEEDIEIAAITGTSAGALNGAALKAGLLLGGRDEARRALDNLWKQVGAVGDQRLVSWMTALLPSVGALNQFTEQMMPISPMDIATQMISPYSYGGLYSNPLERVVNSLDFDKICAEDGPKLFISATNVRTGRVRVFKGAEITTDVILASACLPTVFQAVEVTDTKTGEIEAYWDGGYTGNPALFPLYDKSLPDDVVVVNINPIRREIVPETPQEIQNRVNEISFNSSLLSDLRAINFVKRLLARGHIEQGAMKDVLVHMIADDVLMNTLSVTSKTAPTPYLLFTLKEAGQKACDNFLTHHKADLNIRATVDLAAMFH